MNLKIIIKINYMPSHEIKIVKFAENIILDLSNDRYPTMIYSWTDNISIESKGNLFYGFILEGQATLDSTSGTFTLTKGMYFSAPDGCSVKGGKGIIIESINKKGQFLIGGPTGSTGYLRYINGCTDSMVIPPLMFGEPCLNALFFPKNIKQTPHTHPSFRIGIVFYGKGLCISPEKTEDLNYGDIFFIPSEKVHSFNTSKNKELKVIAFHPDSDYGPKDEEHPMINRTIIDGISAKYHKNTLTK